VIELSMERSRRMNPKGHYRLAELPGTEAALLDLCRPFVHGPFDPQWRVVQPDEIPFPETSCWCIIST